MQLLKSALTAIAALMLLPSPTGAETRLERGRYLITSIMGCGNCHTPRGPDGPLPGMDLAGGYKIESKVFVAYGPNITPDIETGIGRWTDAQIVTALREGRRPDGSIIGTPMPVRMYRGLSDEDMAAIIAALRATRPVANIVPKSEYKMALPASYGPPVGKVAEVPRTDKVAYGRYLAGPAGHCIDCHSPPGPRGAPDTENNLGAGGFVFTGPWGVSVSSNITPTGLARYSDTDLKKVITTGLRPDGSRLKPPMAIPYLAKVSETDLDALVAYLRSLPPK